MRRIIGSGGGGCFPAGVMVMTPAGETPIEQLRIGDEVLSFNDRGIVSVSIVEKVHTHPADDILRMEYWGGSLRTTANHWVLNQFNTFALAGTLTEHDAMVDSVGHLRPLLETHDDGNEPVFNLTVTPDHTFIADNIRVHNGGRGLRRPVVGSGGGDGGKGGGGSSHTPVEDPDSLQSHQYAQIIDLISEGEIGGLVNGLASVFLNDTPIQAADGSMNFTGVTLDYRNGTNDQTNVDGFTDVENEISVNVRVSYGSPVIRTVSGEIDAVRITLGIPQLTNQNMTNGDMNGSSVQVAVSIQNAGGGYKPVPTGYQWLACPAASATQVDAASAYGIGITVNGTFQATTTSVLQSNYDGSWYIDQTVYSSLAWRIEYLPPGGTWTILKTEAVPANGSSGVSMTYYTPQGALGAWSIRAVLTSGGSLSVTGTQLELKYVDTISGKTTSRYKRAYRIPLDGAGPWDIKVERITADSTAASIQNQTWLDSIAEIVDSKLSYPNSAIVAASIDAEQFSNIPSRGYEIYGILCQVPVNYDPLTRVYTGIWNGTFKVAWTDNPAWVFYDIISSNRYGLGDLIDLSNLDKWALYDLAKYCDGLVPSGYGYLEPRYTCNLYIQTREDAYKVLTNMASIFRGMTYWSAGQITTLADKPSDSISIFTNANVIDGIFTYAGSSKSVRHTVALVTWNDPAEMYRQRVEYAEDEDGIKKYGINQTEVLAFGCTSRGQAHRLGKWILYTERLETEIVSFKAGLDGTNVYPGAVIKIADSLRSGDRIGGRVLAGAVGGVTLDAPVTLLPSTGYVLSCVMPDGSVEDRAVLTGAGAATDLLVTPDFSDAPQLHSMWALSSAVLVPQTFRVISVAEHGKTQVDVTALQHDPKKFAMVELDQQFEQAKISTIPATAPTAPMSLVASDTLYIIGPGLVGTKAHFSWQSTAARFEAKWKQDGGNYVSIPSTVNYVDIAPVVEGSISLMVRAIDALGRKSPWASIDYMVAGKSARPSDVPWFLIDNNTMTWGVVNDLDLDGYLIRWQTGNSLSWGDATPLHGGLVFGNSYVMTVRPSGAVTLLIKAVDTSGNESANVTSIVLNLGDPIVNNVIDTVDHHALGFPGTVIGGAVDVGTGDLVADQDPFVAMWSNDLAGVWNTDETTPEWALYTYGQMSYVFSYQVEAGDEGAQLTLPRNAASSSYSVDYRRDGAGPMWSAALAPFWSADEDLLWLVEPWKPWPGSLSAEAVTYEWRITTAPGVVQGGISALAVMLDVADIIERLNDVTIAPAGTRLVLANTYRHIKNISLTRQADGGTARTVVVMDKSATLGPLVQCLDSASVGTTGSIDATIQGY